MPDTLPIIPKNTLWNWFVQKLLAKQLGAIRSKSGLEFYRSENYVVQDFHGTSIVGPKAGLWNKFVWTFFLNELDGVLGDMRWNPTQADTWKIRLQWWLRNPCHNLTWHVIGFAQLYTRRVDFQKEDGPGWNTAMSIASGTLYPFCLFRGTKVVFYIGWRGRGTFGIKLNYKAKGVPQ